MNPKRFAAPVVFLLIGLVGAIYLVRGKPAAGRTPVETESPLTRVVVATPEDLRLRVTSQGTVTPRTESDLVAEVPGTIIAVGEGLEPGAFFREGDILALIDPRDLELSRVRARATLERARAEEEFARAERQRQEVLRSQGIGAAANLDEKQRAARIAEAARIEAEVDLERVERDLSRTRILAPFDGRTRTREIDRGRFVSPGTSLANIYAIDYAEIRLPIPDAELAYLDLPIGNEIEPASAPKVELFARFGGRDHRWVGRIVRVDAEIDPQTRMVNVIARVPRPYEDLSRPPLTAGLFVEAELEGRWVQDVVRLPRSAIDADHRVWVLDEDDRLRLRHVDVLRVERDHALVASGLGPRERVSLLESRLAREGMSVRPLEQSKILAAERPPTEPTS